MRTEKQGTGQIVSGKNESKKVRELVQLIKSYKDTENLPLERKHSDTSAHAIEEIIKNNNVIGWWKR
ncbi:MAG TPA: hypothetical protein DIW17_02780 [Clostridiales bacterium]|nr:hypothetical protein [Clostridiales bacterium]